MLKNIVILFLLFYYSFSIHAQWQQTYSPAQHKINCIHSLGHIFIAGTDNGALVSYNAGDTWQHAGMIGYGITSLASLGGKVIAATYKGGIFISSDSTKSWSASNLGLQKLNITTLIVKGNIVIAGLYYGGLYSSYDTGNSWMYMAPPDPYANAWISSTSIFQDSIQYFSTHGKGVFSYCEKCLGSKWTTLNSNLPLPTDNLFAFSIHVIDSFVFLGTNRGMYASPITYPFIWTKIGLQNYYVYTMYLTDSIIIAGTDYGIFTSYSRGSTWFSKSEGLSDPKIYSLYCTDSILLAGSSSGKIFKRSMNDIQSVEWLKTDKKPFLRVWPNPTHNYCYISLSVEKKLPVRLHIYSSTGEKMQNIRTHIMSEENILQIDLDNLDAGIYILNIDFDDTSSQSKLIIY